MKSDGPLKVLIVDDHDIVRKGLVMLISRQEDILVAGEAGTAAEAVAKTRELSPDVIVMDIRLPDESGIEACREIRSQNPDVKVLMLTFLPKLVVVGVLDDLVPKIDFALEESFVDVLQRA